MGDMNFGGDFVSECVKYQKVLCSPLKSRGYTPENGSEVFVQRIPPEDTEYDLLRFFQGVGDVFQVRLMVKEDGTANRGFGYVTYFNVSDANKAVGILNGQPYKGRHFLIVQNSMNNCRIFVGGIPISKRKDQIWQELVCKGVQNIVEVIMYRSYSERAENRGFVFVEFRTHEEAAHFRAKFARNLKMWGNPVVVDWSVPIPQTDDALMQTVKIIYLRNLDVCQTREELHNTILQFTSKVTIEKVYKFKNYAFIHMVSRECAERLMACLKDYFKSTFVEITWAKPASKYTTQEYRYKKVSYLSSTPSLLRSPLNNRSNSQSITLCSNCSRILQEGRSPEIDQSQNESQLSSNSISTFCQMPDFFNSTIKSLSPYEGFCKELSTTANGIRSTPTLSGHNPNMPSNELHALPRSIFLDKHNYVPIAASALQICKPSLLVRSTPTEAPHSYGMPFDVAAGYHENFYVKPMVADPQQTIYPYQENPIIFYEKRMQEIYDPNEHVGLSSISPLSHDISENDLAILPQDFGAEYLQDFIGELL